MKKLLTGLLMFSQAAVDAVGPPMSACKNAETIRAQSVYRRVDHQNYRDKICTPDLFIVPEHDELRERSSDIFHEGFVTHGPDISATQQIRVAYDAYCYTILKYQDAVRAKASGDTSVLTANKIDENGITAATACVMLKQAKSRDPRPWQGFFEKNQVCPLYR